MDVWRDGITISEGEVGRNGRNDVSGYRCLSFLPVSSWACHTCLCTGFQPRAAVAGAQVYLGENRVLILRRTPCRLGKLTGANGFHTGSRPRPLQKAASGEARTQQPNPANHAPRTSHSLSISAPKESHPTAKKKQRVGVRRTPRAPKSLPYPPGHRKSLASLFRSKL